MNKRLVKLTAVGVAGLACLAVSVVVLLPGDEETHDPSRRGPTRLLRLTEARVEDRPAGAVLVVSGETNLVEGARLSVTVRAKQQEVLRLAATSDGQRFALETPAAGEVVAGAYDVVVSFLLTAQPEAVREELAYQPASLEDRRPLALPLRIQKATAARDEVRELFDAVNRAPRDLAQIEALDARARELASRTWIGERKTALLRLRQALEEARRPEPRRTEFDRLVIEAHVLAGL